jgi:hypothetical protein
MAVIVNALTAKILTVSVGFHQDIVTISLLLWTLTTFECGRQSVIQVIK